MYRPVPRYFFVSRGPVPFKIKVSPLPKANHDLVLRRKTLLVLQFEGYVGAGTAKSAGMEGAAASATNGAQGSASRRAVRMQPRHAMSRGTAPMRLSFNIKAVAPDTHAVISQSSVSCSIQPSTGYFTGTCPLATDTLPTKFQSLSRQPLWLDLESQRPRR
ncbi:hypothetical protein BC831DRAFT_218168 [Entophlyctis helioformis]|nr:hypothetical protein BC831DRAFT_218168 [Entophlyctis helioformis]